MKTFLAAAALALSLPVSASAQAIPAPLIQCGGSWSDFVGRMKELAVSRGYDRGTVDQFFASARQDGATLNADRGQGFFQKTFIDFALADLGQPDAERSGQHAALRCDLRPDRKPVWREPGVLTAFWAFETDFGGFQGDFNTLNSLMTLSHDCRRPGLFQPQVLAALELYTHGDFSPRAPRALGRARSAWSRCCPPTSSRLVSMVTATGTSG